MTTESATWMNSSCSSTQTKVTCCSYGLIDGNSELFKELLNTGKERTWFEPQPKLPWFELQKPKQAGMQECGILANNFLLVSRFE